MPLSSEQEANVRAYAESRQLSTERVRGLTEFLGNSLAQADPRHTSIPKALQYKVFPIIALRRTDDNPEGAVTGDPGVQGTATMLTRDGLFCTAAHCVNVAFGERGITGQNAWDPEDYAVWAVHYGLHAYKACRVLDMCINATCDVAIGRAELPSSTSDFPDLRGTWDVEARTRHRRLRPWVSE